ncbi:MAG: tyramine oxidase subunit B [Lachnospiraceae bacterium]|nr:tyramine oxidase subunit B [Lachnospiraceae bacterium]
MADTRIDFLYLNEQDMIKAGVLDAGHCVDTMEEVLSLLGKGDVLMGGKNKREHGIQLIFPKESPIADFPLEDARDRRFMAMPAYLGGRFHLAGEKWYGSNGRNTAKGLPRSILMVTLNDVETGQPLAYMSANLLSAMRTGAVPGVVAKHLSVKNPKVISLLGPGVVNKTCLMAYMSQFDTVTTIKVKGSSATSKTAQEMKSFIQEKYPQIQNIVLCDTLEEAVRDADIISEATSVMNRQWPVIQPEWIKPGCLIISSGTMDIGDEDFLLKHVRKIVDNYGMYEEYLNIYQEYDEDGNRLPNGTPGMYYANMVNDGLIDRDDVTEMGEILLGEKPGRKSDDEIIVVSVGGMPILDVGWGYECYRKATELGIGTKLNLWDEPYLC